MKLITLFLTCANQTEATRISKALLDKKLIACAKQTSVSSLFYWQGDTDKADEVLLILESSEEKFNQIEQLVKKLHSYDTFVLTAYPIIKASAGVEKWVKESLE